MGNSSKDGSGGGSGGDNSSGRDPPTRTFSEGEKVLAYHGPRIYEAKAKENIMKQQALEKKQGIDRNPKSGRLTQHKPKISADAKVDKEDLKSIATKGKKRKNDAVTEKDNVVAEKLVKIQIPSTLKKQLVDDWEFITQRDKLVKLPRSPTVDDILTSYLEHKSKKDATFLQKNQSTFFLSAYEGFKASEGKGKRKEDRD
ncbi:hypothetical protein CDL15_Pgr001718 [Punica granatum]|uniref:MRG domain-containing protein n=1 Tax=Punica granatum TaxID=22663 RepID=A0A218XB35_PUNGR|nr:hypothetical protein CDL15_Pgr001718 [Punica granatum]